jgi:ABC-type branched-subunit amino acid transport system ATPase component
VKSKSIPAVSASNVDMLFGNFKAVDDASFELEHGRFLTIAEDDRWIPKSYKW